jgi:intracellular sulfur oxidation DsrE/DsrF family protein
MAKLLIHLSDRDKWVAALNLATSLAAQPVTGRWEILIVADIYAGGVCVACNKALSQQMVDFVTAGHRILVCLESLRLLNLPPESLPEFVETIPNSLEEILQRLAEGWQYVKF